MNNSVVSVYDCDSQQFSFKKWRECLVGDIVYLHLGEFIPADVVLLNTSEPLGICYIETSSLDGYLKVTCSFDHILELGCFKYQIVSDIKFDI